jgi:hypothetical protein
MVNRMALPRAGPVRSPSSGGPRRNWERRQSGASGRRSDCRDPSSATGK